MKKAFLLLIGLATSACANPIIGYVQISTATLTAQSGGYNVQKGTHTVGLSVPFISGVQCLHTNTAGDIVGTGADCGVGVAPANGGVIVGVGTQYGVPYYSASGSSNTLAGLSPGTAGQILSTQGGSGPPQWTTFAGSTAYIQNSSSLQSGATAYPSFLYVGSSATVLGPFAAKDLNATYGARVSTVVVTSLSANQCVQTNSDGQLTSTGSGCFAAGSFIQNQNTLQSGATFYVSSCTVNGQLNVNYSGGTNGGLNVNSIGAVANTLTLNGGSSLVWITSNNVSSGQISQAPGNINTMRMTGFWGINANPTSADLTVPVVAMSTFTASSGTIRGDLNIQALGTGGTPTTTQITIEASGDNNTQSFIQFNAPYGNQHPGWYISSSSGPVGSGDNLKLSYNETVIGSGCSGGSLTWGSTCLGYTGGIGMGTGNFTWGNGLNSFITLNAPASFAPGTNAWTWPQKVASKGVWQEASGTFINNALSLSSGAIVGILPSANMVSTAAFTTSSQTWTAPQLYQSSVTHVVSGTTYELTSSSGSANFHVAISTSGHFITSGSAPTISSCGSTPSGSVVGDDNIGTITVGGGSVTACTLTFASPWGGTPSCVITDNSTTIPGDISAISQTAFTSSFNLSLGSGTIWYRCGCSGTSCR